MYRRFIGIIAAASIAITGLGATPAFAERDDELARALAIVLGAAIVGKVIHDKKKKKRQHVTRHDQDPYYTQPRPRHVEPSYPRHVQPHRPRHVDPYRPQHIQPYRPYSEPGVRPRTHIQPHVQPRPLPRAVNRRLLPQQCFRSFRGRGGDHRMFPLRCLENNYAYTQRLPQHCYATFKTPNGKRRGYNARCLYREGYRLALR
ncbi:hypothetical protein [Sulfitobacter aestuariivivens]|uniref:Uncharacterized protein n=1 Tax=Sulfitobacter aestuariivivens TaxID=2766981 RepID=A0A927D8P9_9RHOB|nr:hypothetical protein [Sulfitobacter aestuariivivens]MBD3665642.1 hypothetical protein [Sulfitobacter aestuariivivens]